jgi:hypothetical protein
MKISRALAGAALAGAMLTAGRAQADKPADDFLNPQTMGPRLSFMPLIGPGLRINYDHRFEIEPEISELRTQLIGDVVFPFSEISANVDVRLFLLTFGVSAGYHNEWHVLRFNPIYEGEAIRRAGSDPQGRPNQIRIVDPNFGKDDAGQQRLATKDGELLPTPRGFSDLTRDARLAKDQNADVETDRWPWYEGRLGFIVPAQNFIAVSTAALRQEDRPDVSFDWANGTVVSSGVHLRWETYAFFRDPAIGFIGPALRVMNIPRNRVPRDVSIQVGDQFGRVMSEGDACQFSDPLRLNPPINGMAAPGVRLPCEKVREWELHYGFIGGIRTNWVTSTDVFLTRVYTTYGFDNELFGVHLFGMPIQLLFAYQMDVEL